MNKKPLFTFVSICLLSAASLFAQPFPTGAVIDVDLYESIPRKAVLLSRSYGDGIGPAHSLKQFAPIPNNQSPYGTCTAWASAYAARTIAESIALNRTDRALTTQNVFSPMFVYKNVFLSYYTNSSNPKREGEEGVDGIPVGKALEFIKDVGAVKMQNFEMGMRIQHILLSAYSSYHRYPIADYNTLYASYKLAESEHVRSERVKKAIANDKPVIIAIKCPPSFHSVGKNEVWRPYENPASIDIFKRGNAHALCVVGYDDKKHGGAFEVQNSWGTDWGDGGFVWIPYTVFNKFAYEAYEMIENLSNYETVEFSGFVRIERYNSNQGMPVRFVDGYYRTLDSYPSGMEFRYLLGNNKKAYVYAFAGDSSSNATTNIFPAEGISPVLDYGESIIAFPGEFTWISLDDRAGTDYLVVLYAKEALKINEIRRNFENARGSFPARVAAAVGSNFIPIEKAQYESNEMRFSAQSANPKAVFGLLLAIGHVK